MEKVYKNIDELKEWDKNPKDITPEDFERLVAQVKELGEYKPLLITADGVVLGGNQRLKAYKALKYDKVWVSIVNAPSEADKLKYAISDNDQAGYYKTEDLAALVTEYGLGIDLNNYKVDLGTPVSLADLLNNPAPEGGNDKGSLFDQFIIPPFSVLDTRQGYWQDRKKRWANLIKDRGESRKDVLGFGSLVNTDKYKTSTMLTTSILDPVLAELALRWFTPVGGETFDPFAGDSVFGYVSGFLNHPFVGIELRQEQVDINNARVKQEEFSAYYICDDGQNVGKHLANNSRDLMFSCPPYFDLEVYSDLPNDASNQDSYADFLKILDNAFSAGCKILKDNRFAFIVISDVRGKDGAYLGMPEDIKAIFKRNGLKLYNEFALVNVVGTAAIRAAQAFKSRKVIRTHQVVLVFYKGDLDKIKDTFTELDMGDLSLFADTTAEVEDLGGEDEADD